MKALVGAFNQEKALVGAFSVIVQLHRLTFAALLYSLAADPTPHTPDCTALAYYLEDANFTFTFPYVKIRGGARVL